MLNPVDNIVWLAADSLDANDYNPNAVFRAEMKLLEFSILKQGWVQPVLVTADHTIIDGFHRVMLSIESKALLELFDGRVPCSIVQVDRPGAMMVTIRMNRAKGTHVALRMADIIKELIDIHGIDPEQIAGEIGAHKSEIDLLYQDSVFTAKKIKNYKYSKAWYPEEKPA